MRLMRLEDSEQVADIYGGKAPSKIYGGVGRIKTYVKPQDMVYGQHVRELEFDQPYQVAAEALDCGWNQTNPVFLVQASGCNLACPGCFLGDSVRNGSTLDMEPDEIISLWEDQNESMVLRISGGEPLLQMEDVAAIASFWADECAWNEGDNPYGYLWLDTNLTVEPSADLLSALVDCQPYASVSGCFKPHLGPDGLASQYENAHTFIEAGVSFFAYWPVTLDDEQAPVDHWPVWTDRGRLVCEQLAENVHPKLPLRTTFLFWKYHYNALALAEWKAARSDEWQAMDGQALTELSALKTHAYREGQAAYCTGTYDPEIYWLPSNQVEYE